jgi:hypothetical protein
MSPGRPRRTPRALASLGSSDNHADVPRREAPVFPIQVVWGVRGARERWAATRETGDPGLVAVRLPRSRLRATHWREAARLAKIGACKIG